MAKQRFTKSTLPHKSCVVCGRPFAWRKKWERVWDEVKYCSDRCRSHKALSPRP
ncbi:MAG: DUF2256 domain-containing protein [Candidatus Kapabacteria bacterium]|nr:DUF2256 domain-containing protein [Candidatus Kapabacteria bacterium]